MRCLRTLAVSLTCLAVVSCSYIAPPDIADLNGNPHRYYQTKLTVVGQISRMQVIGNEVLLEVADAREKRVLVKANSADDLKPSDWIKASGLFVPEIKIGNQTVYDAVMAEEISRARAPMFRNLF